ncbi:hypothetical protein RI054_05g30220 [Pseudoscourfieldia marina]
MGGMDDDFVRPGPGGSSAMPVAKHLNFAPQGYTTPTIRTTQTTTRHRSATSAARSAVADLRLLSFRHDMETPAPMTFLKGDLDELAQLATPAFQTQGPLARMAASTQAIKLPPPTTTTTIMHHQRHQHHHFLAPVTTPGRFKPERGLRRYGASSLRPSVDWLLGTHLHSAFIAWHQRMLRSLAARRARYGLARKRARRCVAGWKQRVRVAGRVRRFVDARNEYVVRETVRAWRRMVLEAVASRVMRAQEAHQRVLPLLFLRLCRANAVRARAHVQAVRACTTVIARSLLRRSFARWLSCTDSTWHRQRAVERAYEVLLRVLRRSAKAAWVAWSHFVEGEKAFRGRLVRAARIMRVTRLELAISRWSRFALRRTTAKKVIARIQLRSLMRDARAVMRVWRLTVTKIAAAREVAMAASRAASAEEAAAAVRAGVDDDVGRLCDRIATLEGELADLHGQADNLASSARAAAAGADTLASALSGESNFNESVAMAVEKACMVDAAESIGETFDDAAATPAFAPPSIGRRDTDPGTAPRGGLPTATPFTPSSSAAAASTPLPPAVFAASDVSTRALPTEALRAALVALQRAAKAADNERALAESARAAQAKAEKERHMMMKELGNTVGRAREAKGKTRAVEGDLETALAEVRRWQGVSEEKAQGVEMLVDRINGFAQLLINRTTRNSRRTAFQSWRNHVRRNAYAEKTLNMFDQFRDRRVVIAWQATVRRRRRTQRIIDAYHKLRFRGVFIAWRRVVRGEDVGQQPPRVLPSMALSVCMRRTRRRVLDAWHNLVAAEQSLRARQKGAVRRIAHFRMRGILACWHEHVERQALLWRNCFKGLQNVMERLLADVLIAWRDSVIPEPKTFDVILNQAKSRMRRRVLRVGLDGWHAYLSFVNAARNIELRSLQFHVGFNKSSILWAWHDATRAAFLATSRVIRLMRRFSERCMAHAFYQWLEFEDILGIVARRRRKLNKSEVRRVMLRWQFAVRDEIRLRSRHSMILWRYARFRDRTFLWAWFRVANGSLSTRLRDDHAAMSAELTRTQQACEAHVARVEEETQQSMHKVREESDAIMRIAEGKIDAANRRIEETEDEVRAAKARAAEADERVETAVADERRRSSKAAASREAETAKKLAEAAAGWKRELAHARTAAEKQGATRESRYASELQRIRTEAASELHALQQALNDEIMRLRTELAARDAAIEATSEASEQMKAHHESFATALQGDMDALREARRAAEREVEAMKQRVEQERADAAAAAEQLRAELTARREVMYADLRNLEARIREDASQAKARAQEETQKAAEQAREARAEDQSAHSAKIDQLRQDVQAKIEDRDADLERARAAHKKEMEEASVRQRERERQLNAQLEEMRESMEEQRKALRREADEQVSTAIERQKNAEAAARQEIELMRSNTKQQIERESKAAAESQAALQSKLDERAKELSHATGRAEEAEKSMRALEETRRAEVDKVRNASAVETELRGKLKNVTGERDNLVLSEKKLRHELEIMTREHKVWSQLQHELENLREQNRQLKGGEKAGEEALLTMLHTD